MKFEEFKNGEIVEFHFKLDGYDFIVKKDGKKWKCLESKHFESDYWMTNKAVYESTTFESSAYEVISHGVEF